MNKENNPPPARLKEVATEFYYWWHNQPGTNTQQGFDDWWELNHSKFSESLTAQEELAPYLELDCIEDLEEGAKMCLYWNCKSCIAASAGNDIGDLHRAAITQIRKMEQFEKEEG